MGSRWTRWLRNQAKLFFGRRNPKRRRGGSSLLYLPSVEKGLAGWGKTRQAACKFLQESPDQCLPQTDSSMIARSPC